MVRFATGAGVIVFAITIGCDAFLALAHRALCACAILRREAADIIRVGADLVPVGADVIPVGWLVVPDTPEPFSDSIAEIAVSNFSTCNCTCLRSSRSCWSALARFPIGSPSYLTTRLIVEG